MFHVGSARSALFNWIVAKQGDEAGPGTFVLRIEDTDEARNHPDWTQGIVDAMAWLGMSGADPVFEGPYFQSSYADAHRAAAERLFAQGDAYYCDCTRDDIDARNKGTGRQGYDGHCRQRTLSAATGRALRFKIPQPGSTTVVDSVRGTPTFDHATLEDFVILRGNGSPMFLLANAVDDIEMGISLVIRAEEHLPNTPKQQLLWLALGHEPPTWAHVPVLVNEKRQKLSKRRDKVALEQFEHEGYLASAMKNYLMTLGWSPPGDQEIVPWEQIEAQFRIDDVTSSPAFFDLKKLRAFNADYIRALPVEDFIDACAPWVTGPDTAWPEERFNPNWFAVMAPLVQSRVTLLAEAPDYVDFLFMADPPDIADDWVKGMRLADAPDVLDDTIEAWTNSSWDAVALKEAFDALAEARGLKPGKAGGPVRVAVTGRTVGPPLYEAVELLGRDETLRRLRQARARC